MKIKSLFSSLFILLGTITGAAAQAVWQTLPVETTASLRGLSVVNERIVWASGTGGTVLRSVDGGATWDVRTVAGADQLDFRDVDAFDAQTAYVLSIGKGEASRIYKTTDGGATWQLKFQNAKPEAFFDAMAWWDAEHGIAMSDPVDGRFVLITTDDGGATWNPVLPNTLPAALPNEGGFAASGTCIAVQGRGNVWFVTGGAKTARVFRSTNRGDTWTVAETPLLAGVAAAGIFSSAWRDGKRGIIVGGDYQKPSATERNVAFTEDGGVTWKLASGTPPAGFRSGVVWARNRWIAVGTAGSDESSDGKSWRAVDQQNYNAVAADRRGNVWAVGPKGRVARLTNSKDRK